MSHSSSDTDSPLVKRTHKITRRVIDDNEEDEDFQGLVLLHDEGEGEGIVFFYPIDPPTSYTDIFVFFFSKNYLEQCDNFRQRMFKAEPPK